MTVLDVDGMDAAMAGQVSKNVSLTPELDAYIGAEVAAGRYQNASEVVRAALRLMFDHDVQLVPRSSAGSRLARAQAGGAKVRR